VGKKECGGQDDPAEEVRIFGTALLRIRFVSVLFKPFMDLKI
jgi:hypothetical protein